MPGGRPEVVHRRRMRAADLFEAGWTAGEVARKFGLNIRTAGRWKRAFEEQGREGLAARRATGRPPRLDARRLERLRRLLLKGARACGFATDLWTCRRVAELIRREFRVKYHADHVGRILRKMEFSPQKPERRARERDEAAIARWVERRVPRVKKTPSAGRRTSRSSTRAGS